MNIRNIIRGESGTESDASGSGAGRCCLPSESLVLGTNFFLLLFNTRTHPNTHLSTRSVIFCFYTLLQTRNLYLRFNFCFFSGKLRPRAGAGQAAVAAETKTYTSFRAGKIVLSHYHYRGPSIASDFVAGLYFFIYKNIKNTKKIKPYLEIPRISIMLVA